MLRRLLGTYAADNPIDDSLRKLVATVLVLAALAGLAWLVVRVYTAEDRARTLQDELRAAWAQAQALRQRVTTAPGQTRAAQEFVPVADANTAAPLARMPLTAWSVPGAEIRGLRISASYPVGDYGVGQLVLTGQIRNATAQPAHAVYLRVRVLNFRGALLLEELAAFPGVLDPNASLPFRMNLATALVKRPDVFDVKGWGRVEVAAEYAGVAEAVGLIEVGR